MTIQKFAIVLGLLSVSGCVVAPAPIATAPAYPPVIAPTYPPVTTVPNVSRSAATSAISREMALKLPGVNVGPYSDCVVQNATEAEMADIAALSTSGVSVNAAVATIVRRPGTASCIASVRRAA